MTIVDKYPGSKGGQPRLFIPNPNIAPDDPNFQAKMEANWRTLQTQFNSLILSTPSSMVAFAWFHSVQSWNAPMSWVKLNGNYDYTAGGTGPQLTQFPANSVTLIVIRCLAVSTTPTAFPAIAGMEAHDSALGNRDSWEANTTVENPWWVSPILSFQIDSTSGVPLPITTTLFSNNIAGSPTVNMFCYSWGHP